MISEGQWITLNPKYVEISPAGSENLPVTHIPGVKPVAKPYKVQVTSKEGIFVRAGPGKSYTKISSVMQDEQKTIIDTSQDNLWGQIAPGEWISLDPTIVRKI